MLGIFKFLFRKAIKKYENEIAALKRDVKTKDENLASNLNAINEKDEKIQALNEESEKKEVIIQQTQEEILKLEKDIKNAVEEITSKNIDLQSQNDKLEFIAQVINSQPEKNKAYEKFLTLLNTDYMKYANENDSLAAEAAALLKLQSVADQLELLTYDGSLLNKTIVAIAGSFSSGKSSFMNSFFTTRKVKLPTGMDQTTAISSYVMNGEESITGYSFKGGRVNISNNIFSLFSYGKVEEFSFNMKQIINHIVIKNQFAKTFNNLCFIDTPGFNPGQETESDYNTATSAIATATSIIWCIDASAGTIKDDEFDILYDIFCKNENAKIYIVLNKADLKSVDENVSVMDEIENQLSIKCIPFEGITLYTSKSTFVDQPEECKTYRGISLEEFLERNNCEDTQKEELLLKTTDEVFEDYINADSQRIKKLETQIRTLKILESSFSSINDTKDEQIAYYKARIDSKHHKIKQFDDSFDTDEALFDSLADLKSELKQTIEKDKSDMAKAKALCVNMKKAVSEVFGHELKEHQYDFNAKEALQLDEKELAKDRIIIYATDSSASTGDNCRWQFERKKGNGSVVKFGEEIASIKVFKGRSTKNYEEDCPVYAKTEGKIYYLQNDSLRLDTNSAVAVICSESDTKQDVLNWAKHIINSRNSENQLQKKNPVKKQIDDNNVLKNTSHNGFFTALFESGIEKK